MMVDREKVIKWLDVCKTADKAVGLKEDYPCRECPYKDSSRCMRELVADALALIKEQEAEMRQLRLALDIAKGTCKGIKSGGGQFADMPTMQSAT